MISLPALTFTSKYLILPFVTFCCMDKTIFELIQLGGQLANDPIFNKLYEKPVSRFVIWISFKIADQSAVKKNIFGQSNSTKEVTSNSLCSIEIKSVIQGTVVHKQRQVGFSISLKLWLKIVSVLFNEYEKQHILFKLYLRRMNHFVLTWPFYSSLFVNLAINTSCTVKYDVCIYCLKLVERVCNIASVMLHAEQTWCLHAVKLFDSVLVIYLNLQWLRRKAFQHTFQGVFDGNIWRKIHWRCSSWHFTSYLMPPFAFGLALKGGIKAVGLY